MRLEVLENTMNINKDEILHNICYTELGYARINKKLNTDFSKEQIENLILRIIDETPATFFEKAGKNYYIINPNHCIKITINSNTFRVITVDEICFAQ